jgi:hypothetical protein
MSSYEKCIRSEKISDTEWLYGVIDVLQRAAGEVFEEKLPQKLPRTLKKAAFWGRIRWGRLTWIPPKPPPP